MRNTKTPRSDCSMCGDSESGSVELCSACRDGLRWVIRPEAHRESRRRQNAATPAGRDALNAGHPLIGMLPKENGTWSCDLCDTRIDVPAEFTLIPLVGSSALCAQCVQRLPAWPKGWTHPRPRACRCRACQTPLAIALTL